MTIVQRRTLRRLVLRIVCQAYALFATNHPVGRCVALIHAEAAFNRGASIRRSLREGRNALRSWLNVPVLNFRKPR